MKKITLFVAAALATISAFAYELPADAVEIYALEQTFAPGSGNEGTAYAYTYVSLASDFEDAEKTLDGTYDGLAITFTGEAFQFRFEVESFVDGQAQGNKTAVNWITGEHSDAGNVLLTSLDGEVPSTAETSTTVYLKLTDEILARFADGDACMHVHFGDQGSTGTMTITKAYLFSTSGTGIEDVIADSIESGKAIKTFDENGQVVIVKGGEVFSILGAKIK